MAILTLAERARDRVRKQGTMPGGRSVSFRVKQIAAAVLLLLMFVLAGAAAWRESITIDEVAHIGAGLSYVQKLDLRLNDEHPPLVKVLAGVPVALGGARADYSSPQWTLSAGFFPGYLGEWVFGDWVIGHWNDPRRTLLLARIPMLLLTLLLGWVIFVLGCRIGGEWGGLLALTAYVTTPTFLTFGPLVLTDVAIALFTLLTLWTLGRLWQIPDPRNTRWFGLAFAGALLSKFSSGILLIAIVTFVLSTRWWPIGQPAENDARRAWRKLRWRAVRRGILLAAAVTYVFYFVFSWNQPPDIPGLAGHGPLLGFLGRLLMPPWLFLRGLGWVLLTAVRPTFLLGHSYSHGIWFYFPVLLVLKSLPEFLGLLLLTLGLAIWQRRRSRTAVIPAELAPQWRAIWISVLVFTAICMVGTMDVSIRHFSVPLALLTLLIAPLPRLIERLTPGMARAAAVAAGALAVLCLITVIRIYPYYMQYVSPAGMGRPLYWLMSDSNVDWDQALPEVQQFAEQHGLTDVPVDDYALSPAQPFVPHARSWDCQAPAPEDAGHWVFVSANMILDGHNCAWILQYPHQALAAGGMYAIHLPSALPTPGTPAGPPPPEARRIFLDSTVDMRTVFRQLSDHPDQIQKTFDEMMAQWRKAQEEARRKKNHT